MNYDDARSTIREQASGDSGLVLSLRMGNEPSQSVLITTIQSVQYLKDELAAAQQLERSLVADLVTLLVSPRESIQSWKLDNEELLDGCSELETAVHAILLAVP